MEVVIIPLTVGIRGKVPALLISVPLESDDTLCSSPYKVREAEAGVRGKAQNLFLPKPDGGIWSSLWAAPSLA